MRRRLLALGIGVLSALAVAGPALADTSPGPGNFRDSGSTRYLNSGASECGQNTCTDTYVYGQITDLQGGDTYMSVCFEQYTYPARQGGQFTQRFGCSEVDAPTIADDLSSASVDVTLLVTECGRRTCSGESSVTVTADFSAIGSPNAYSYTQKQQYETCTDTYRVRGQSVDAAGTIGVDGASLDAFAQIGSETFAFSSRCR
jgi:hypothetical protein